MREISVFDVIGPNMIGPSSSHTAGALRIALMAKKMTKAPIKKVRFILYGSFAQTYRGHGTDRALLGGILGLIIMLVLGYLGSTHLLTPTNVLLYQLIWAVPGLLVTEWTRVV